MTDQTNNVTHAYVASLNEGKCDGLVLYTMDSSNGGLRLQASCGQGVKNPLYLATDLQQRFLYVADFVESCEGKPGGAVSAYSIDARTGALRFLNKKSSEGTVPCYVSVTANGKFVLVANYGDGKVAVLPVQEDGKLGDAVDVKQHAPSADAPKRKANAHSIVLDQANRFALAGELGLDKVMIYRFDAATGKLTPAGDWTGREKSGPRHFTFHPNGQFAYVINEYANTVVAFAYDSSSGELTELQTLSSLPEGFAGKTYAADLHVHPNGKFLYSSNRGHESIAIFSIDANTGKLSPLGHEPTQGKFPRSFCIDPSGRFLLVANEKSDAIVSFRIDPQGGKLTPTGQTVQVTAPACLYLMPASSP